MRFLVTLFYVLLFFLSGIGCKKNPFHVLIPHGEIPLTNSLTLEHFTHKELFDWFGSEYGQSEGIIWHSNDGLDMFKV